MFFVSVDSSPPPEPAMSRLAASLLIAAVATLGACSPASSQSTVAEPAKPVELNRYLGKWYELARYDMVFERGCEGVTAEYSMRPDGKVRVLNTCRKGASHIHQVHPRRRRVHLPVLDQLRELGQ